MPLLRPGEPRGGGGPRSRHVELELITCHCAGRVFLVPVLDRREGTSKKVIDEHVAGKVEIWTDSLTSYHGSENRGRHKAANHSKGEFA